MNDNYERTLEYAQSRLKLSDTEKALHRDQLLATMRLAKQKAAIPSPYAHFFTYGLRYAFALVLVVLVSSSGAALAAEQALPGNPLYAIKVNINESIQIALTTDPKSRADLEVDLVNEHLEDLSRAAVNGDLDKTTADAAVHSLNDRINAAQADIAALHANQNAADALDTATDLGATLNAHADILDRVAAANPDLADALDTVATAVDDSITETAALIATTTASFEAATSTDLNDAVDAQQADAAESLADLRDSVESSLAALSADDRAAVSDDLADIQEIVATAQAKDASGNEKSAFTLYLQASEKITALQTTLDASQNLDVDVIGTSTDSGS
jgi:hypothetical protein